MRKIFATNNDPVLTWLRLLLGIVFFAHGAQKMLGWFGGHGFSATMTGMEKMGIPAVFVFLAICAEFFGSLGLIFGLLTRVAAFGISVNMVVAILMVHARNGFFMNWSGHQRGEGFEYHLLALAVAITLMIRGGGAASIDRLIWSSGEKARAVGPRLARIA